MTTKKTFKIIAYGIAGIIVLAFCTLLLVLPAALADHTKNNNWLWFYLIPVTAFLILLGDFIYEVIDQ